MAGEDEAPSATGAGRGWREVLFAAALQGAIFALVKAAVDRGAAEGTRKLTGVWPGDEGKDRKDCRGSSAQHQLHKRQASLSAAAVNGSNRIVLSCPRSADINALTCLDDLY